VLFSYGISFAFITGIFLRFAYIILAIIGPTTTVLTIVVDILTIASWKTMKVQLETYRRARLLRIKRTKQ
jgi:hypothetical protein